MFHTAAFFQNVDNAALAEVNALTDQVLSIESNRFALREPMLLLWASIIGSTITRARLSMPSLRQITNPDLAPYNVATEPGADPNVADFRAFPFRLPSNEQLSLETVNSGASAVDHWGIVSLAVTPPARANGNPIYTLRGVSTTTLTADTWSPIAVTWDDDLPAGQYQCVGLRVESAGGIAARVRFEGQLWRPGVLANDGVLDKGWPMARRGGLGVFGSFDSRQMPTPEVLSLSADTAETVYMDLQKA